MTDPIEREIDDWYLRNAPQAVLAEIREAREYAERSGVTKVQAVGRFVDCEHNVGRLLSPFPEKPQIEERMATLEADNEQLRDRVSQLERELIHSNPKNSKRKAAQQGAEQQ